MARPQFLQYSLLSVSAIAGLAIPPAWAAPPPPATVTSLLAAVDRAANNKQLGELNNSFAANYTVDGLNRDTWEKALSQFWQRYPKLRYQTVLQSWKPEGNSMVIDTLTTITGSRIHNGQPATIAAQIRARQKITGGKIVQQQILSEKTLTTSGSKPPTVDLNIPDKLKTNESYSIDAIVQEPLGDDVMMGTIVEQAVSAAGYSQPQEYSLELLATGGLFKNAKAPGKSGDYWLSATFIRPGGMTTVTRRIHVLRR